MGYLVLCIAIICICIWICNGRIKDAEDSANKRIKEYESRANKKLESDLDNYRKEIYNNEKALRQDEINRELSSLNWKLVSINRQIEDKENFNSSLLKVREDELDRLMEEKKKTSIERIRREVDEWSESAQEAAAINFSETESEYTHKINQYKSDLNLIIKELDDYKLKQQIVNEEIIRSRAVKEQQDFYRIQLDENTLNDIQILNNIKSKLSKIDILNKLMYDNYISKPTKEMIKRVLRGTDAPGIYKVTNIETNEVYIGKSKTMATRWTNHVKSAYGLEGVADSQFQRALKKYGIEKFTWEQLEACSSDMLTEREKYWISFYGTKNYGYNQREG